MASVVGLGENFINYHNLMYIINDGILLHYTKEDSEVICRAFGKKGEYMITVQAGRPPFGRSVIINQTEAKELYKMLGQIIEAASSSPCSTDEQDQKE